MNNRLIPILLFSVAWLTLCNAYIAKAEVQSVVEDENAASSLLLRGDEAMTLMLYDNAAEYYEQYLKLLPDGDSSELLMIQLRLARAYLAQKALPQANKYMQQAKSIIDAQPEDLAMDFEFCLLQARILQAEGDFNACLQLLSDLESRRNLKKRMMMQIALLRSDVLVTQKRWEEAAACLELALEKTSRSDEFDIELRERLAQIYIALERYDVADRFVRSIIGHVPVGHQIMLNILIIKCAAARHDFEAVYEIWPSLAGKLPVRPDENWWQMLWLVSTNLVETGRYEQAFEFLPLAQSMASIPEDAAACILLAGSCYERCGRLADAMEKYMQLRAEYRDVVSFVTATGYLANLKSETGDYAAAALLYQEIMNSQVATPTAKFQAANAMADCFMHLLRYDDACDAYLRASNLDISVNERAVALMWAAECREKQQNFELAIEIYAQVKSRFPESTSAPNADLARAKLYEQMGNTDVTLEILRKYLVDFPEHARHEEVGLEVAVLVCALAKSSQEQQVALENLLKCAREATVEQIAISAYFEASRNAMKIGDYLKAADILEDLLERFPAHEQAETGWYNCLVLRQQLGMDDEVMKLAQRFFDEVKESRIVDQINLLMGEFCSSRGNFEQALDYYDAVGVLPLREAAARAIFEAAVCLSNLERHGESLKKLETLVGNNFDEAVLRAISKSVNNDLLLGRIAMLAGDEKSFLNDYDGALACYAVAEKLAGDDMLALLAVGRQAEMLLVKSDDIANVEQAKNMLTEILKDSDDLPIEIRHLAEFRLAQCFEKMEQPMSALDWYSRIILDYAAMRDSGKVVDWRYYVESVFAATNLLKARGDTISMRQAVLFYDDLAKSNLPRSREAAILADEIRGNGQVIK